jgi:hypothetical protein
MYILDQHDIQKIENRLVMAQVNNCSLSIDLVDHICCMIEERIDRGMNVKKAEEEVFKEMGEVQLKAIDIETTLLTQSKFIMKKRTKIIGILGLVLVIAGFTMKMNHLAGAGVTWGVGILILAFGFFLFVLVDRLSYEKSNVMRISIVVGYIGSALLIVGLGLVLLKWPVAVYLAESGSILLLFYFILNNTLANNQKESQF